MVENKQQKHKTSSPVTPSDLTTEMKSDYYLYGMYTIEDRAIPVVYDNMKPIQRKILHAMNQAHMASSKLHKKCVEAIGLVTQYSAHGDQSIYGAIVRMSQDFKVNVPYLDGQGSYGWVDGSRSASARYIETRLAKYAEECLLKDLSKTTVSWGWNYNETREEPEVLPAVVPDILINGNTGIAVGFVCNWLPHNPVEVTKACIAYVKNRRITLAELCEVMPGPDFPTGGVINGLEGVKRAYEGSVGSCTVRAKVHQEKNADGYDCIVITEIPYMTTTTGIMEKIAAIGDSDKVKIKDIQDESSGATGVRIVIILKKEEEYTRALNYLYKNSPLECRINMNHNALEEGKKLTAFGLLELMEQFVAFREDIIHRKLKEEMGSGDDRLHILEGLTVINQNMDKAIAMIRSSKGREDSVQKLKKTFGLSQIQAEYIADLRLYRISNLEMQQIQKEKNDILERKKVLALWTKTKSNQYIDKIMLDEWEALLSGIFKGMTRKTKIQKVADTIALLDTIKEEEVTLVTTQKNFVKIIAGHVTVPDRMEDWELEHGDQIREVIHTNSLQTALWIMDTGHAFQLPIHKIIEEVGHGGRGKLIRNIVGAKPYSNIVSTSIVEEKRPILVTVTTDGTIKTTKIFPDLVRISPAGRLLHTLSDKSERIVSSFCVHSAEDIMMLTEKGMIIRFQASQIRPSGVGAGGVIGIRSKGHKVVSAFCIREEDSVLLVDSDGKAKRVDVSEFRSQSRGGTGVICSVPDNPEAIVVGVLPYQEGNTYYYEVPGARIQISNIGNKSKHAKWDHVSKKGGTRLWVVQAHGNKKDSKSSE